MFKKFLLSLNIFSALGTFSNDFITNTFLRQNYYKTLFTKLKQLC